MITKIYLIRHAAAEGNLYRVAHGQFNSTITSHGYRQLAHLRRRFEGVRLDAVYGSDLLRAHATASALYVPRGLEFRPMPLLREVCMGAWEQLSWGEVARLDAEMYDNFNNRPDLWQVEGAETFDKVRERMLAAVRQMAAENPGKTIAATSHGAAMRILLGTLQGMSLAEIGKTPYGENTAVSLLEAEGDELRLICRDDASHLPARAKVFRHAAQGTKRHAVTATQPGCWFRTIAQDGESRELEAMLGEDSVGRVAFHGEGGAVRITKYEIVPALRARHYSVQLLGQAVKFARTIGCEDVVLTCDASLAAYFEKHGFSVTGHTPDGTELTLDIRRVIRDIPE